MPDWVPPISFDVGDVPTHDDFNQYVSENTPYLFRQESTVSVTNTTTETNLVSFTIAANQMGLHRRALLSMSGGITNSTGSSRNAPRFRLKLGGTTIFDINLSTLDQISSNAGEGIWLAWAEIKQVLPPPATDVAEQRSFIRGRFAPASQLNFTTGSGLFRDTDATKGKDWWGRNSTAVDMTSSRALVWTVVNGFASASYTTSLRTATLQIL